MSRKKRLAGAAAILFVAFGVGHLMQYGLGLGTPYPQGAEDVEADVPPLPDDPDTARLRLPAGVRFASLAGGGPGSSALADAPHEVVIRHSVPADPFAWREPVPASRFSSFGLPCDVAFDLAAVPGGALRGRLTAACHPGARVDVSHGGLRFAIRTSELGLAEIALPALAESATVTVHLPDGQEATATARVSDAPDYDRVALGWTGAAAMSIHAFEFGAAYGMPGHVHRGSPGQPGGDGPHGEIVLLGDPGLDRPMLAEVYTFPTGIASGQGAIRLHVEAEVTPETCGREIEGEAIQSIPFGPPSVTSLRLDMPECDAVGDIVVLKNILRDLRIASN